MFRREGNIWSEEATLTASDPIRDANFGRYVSIDGDTVLLGAPKGRGDELNAVYEVRMTGPCDCKRAKTAGWYSI